MAAQGSEFSSQLKRPRSDTDSFEDFVRGPGEGLEAGDSICLQKRLKEGLQEEHLKVENDKDNLVSNVPIEDIIPSEFPGMNEHPPEVYVHAEGEDELEYYLSGGSGDGSDNTGSQEEDNISEMSDLSGMSAEEEWRSMAGPISWVHRQMAGGREPREILHHLLPHSTFIPDEVDDLTLWKIVVEILSEPPKRKKLSHVNTMDDVVELIKRARNIIVLTGAGVSVSCGIPDFRSRNGIYARLSVDYPDLPDPQAMFDIRYFRNNPKPFFKFAKEIYPGQFQPSPCHRFIKLLEDHEKLLRNYAQNIDTLEQVAGIQNVIQCHGSFATATCMTCKYKVDANAVKEDIMKQVIPRCPNCPPEAEMPIMKPDIVFFGESLPEEFHKSMSHDKDNCDLLIVIGSSLKVRPVALIPNSVSPHVPQILINREPLKHLNFDVELLGDCDGIVQELCRRLGEGWGSLCSKDGEKLTEISKDCLPTPPESPCLISRSSPHFAGHIGSDERVPEPTLPAQDEVPCASVPSKQSAQNACVETSEQIAIELKDESQAEQANVEKESDQTPISEVDRQFSENSDSNMSSNKQQYSVDEEVSSITEVSSIPTDDGDSKLASTTDLAALRECWIPKKKQSIALRLPEHSYLHVPPNRYVFPGAEVFSEDDSGAESSDGEPDLDDINEEKANHHIHDKPENEISDNNSSVQNLSDINMSRPKPDQDVAPAYLGETLTDQIDNEGSNSLNVLIT
ncbi:NAD-dependent protein deacetylase sirtuin-1 isoform X2 [Lingula anatina]|uniref:protein acetyllysine N-acetyltransferase n=1 Tax=Lingula anatina TaxID=7574 RepID=A0A1S3JLZ2_LINAN|nr:NAD-dependent protein deacetylase sirtuin-1 isoform X2 [Lingula anatina]|eukprot:XP_013411403.1 NAD-dependent protein deacetylase sirtuin-1 isoform X2 [Lingula anatina]